MCDFPKIRTCLPLFGPLLLLLLSSCVSDSPSSPGDVNGELESASPASQNVDSALLDAAFEHARSISGLKSVLVARNGFIVAETYFNGTRPNDLLHVRSVTKSVVSTLVGIAIERDQLEGLQQTLGDLIELNDLQSNKSPITLEQLLTMTGGFEWNETGGSEFSQWVNSGDQVDYVLNQPLSDDPGSRFNYNSGATHLLSVILTRATGQSLQAYADEVLFGPLSITRRGWDRDSDGNYYGGHGLQLRPRDMAKFGLLFLQQGQWADEQIVRSSWVAAAAGSQIQLNFPFSAVPDVDYGYLWWLDSTRNAYWAWGYGGQFVYCHPGLNLVVVTASEWFVSSSIANAQESANMDLVINYILPAVKP